ncbi:unnamed protein product, partial [Phaeothamnion confervicola]
GGGARSEAARGLRSTRPPRRRPRGGAAGVRSRADKPAAAGGRAERGGAGTGSRSRRVLRLGRGGAAQHRHHPPFALSGCRKPWRNWWRRAKKLPRRGRRLPRPRPCWKASGGATRCGLTRRTGKCRLGRGSGTNCCGSGRMSSGPKAPSRSCRSRRGGRPVSCFCSTLPPRRRQRRQRQGHLLQRWRRLRRRRFTGPRLDAVPPLSTDDPAAATDSTTVANLSN